MRTRARTRIRARIPGAALLALLLGGCAGEAPPLDELPLRDALGADPDVIASLPVEAKRALAERLEAARKGESEAEEVQPDGRGTPAAEVRDADIAREARGDDALMTAIVSPQAGVFVVRPQRLEEAAAARALPPMDGQPPSASTADAEAQALAGRGGAIVAALVERAGATHVARVVGWPAGAVAVGDTVYVNASWLVALAAIEDGGNAKTAPRAPPMTSGPPLTPLSVKGNPYVTYASLEACVSDVDSRCQQCLTFGGCGDEPALADFKTANDECTFLAVAAPTRTEELCAAVLLSIKLIADCVRAENRACVIPAAAATSASLDGLQTFIGDPLCLHALDVCLGSPTTPSTGGGSTITVSKCEDPFSACVSSCNSLNNSCKTNSCSGTSSNSSCSSCQNTGSSSSSSCSSCGGSSGSSSSSCGKGSSDCGKCETSPAPAFPLGDTAWLIAPLAYVFLRPRRRA